MHKLNQRSRLIVTSYDAGGHEVLGVHPCFFPEDSFCIRRVDWFWSEIKSQTTWKGVVEQIRAKIFQERFAHFIHDLLITERDSWSQPGFAICRKDLLCKKGCADFIRSLLPCLSEYTHFYALFAPKVMVYRIEESRGPEFDSVWLESHSLEQNDR